MATLTNVRTQGVKFFHAVVYRQQRFYDMAVECFYLLKDQLKIGVLNFAYIAYLQEDFP